jgi:NADH:ubiquinone oxidoreductase subunit 4 (subunit M)
MVQRAFHGELSGMVPAPDLSRRESGMMALMIIAIFWLGLYPRPVMTVTEKSLIAIQAARPLPAVHEPALEAAAESSLQRRGAR